MSPSKRRVLADEELGKKDDDHRPRRHSEQRWQQKQWKLRRRRRIVLATIILCLFYLFFRNMPTDLPPATQRLEQELHPQQSGKHPAASPPQSDPPPRGTFTSEDKDDSYYDGKLQFPNLRKSLKSFQKPPGKDGKVASTATVFAAARLESVSDLLPLACRMSNRKSNEVHFLLMGRDDVSIEGLQRVNGVNSADCLVNWHDARVDYARGSADERMEEAVATALQYIRTYLRPQVIITQKDSWEEPFFLKGIQKSEDLGVPHIALPRAARELGWISKLDGSALRAWNDIHFEILIYAAPESSGPLIRLLRSLENADFLGFSPSLTIELPSRVDSEVLRFLKEMKWPTKVSSKVTVRRRIQSHMSPVVASLRAVEAFYPRDPALSHVLVLSPNIELAPSFYHYLMYTVLKYKHSTPLNMQPSKLMGVSLELPSFRLTDAEPSRQPDIDNTQFASRNDPGTIPLFLWQAPNSNAALYFGDKWAELHSFLAHRLASQDTSAPHEKVMSKRLPAFMEFLLELIRARGYYLLYPAFSHKGRFSLATLHGELFQYPEEFSQDMPEPPSKAIEESRSSERLLSREPTLMPLLDTFPVGLPQINRLPILSYRGEEMSDYSFRRDTLDYLGKFRVRYGGCSDGSSEKEMDTANLFCAAG